MKYFFSWLVCCGSRVSRPVILSSLLIFLITFLCFSPSLKNGLLDWDDSGYVLNNEHIRTISIAMIRWAFTTTYCNYWAPLTWLSLAFDYAVAGLNPLVYHFTNNVLHSFNAAILFVIAHQLLSKYVLSHSLTTNPLPKNVTNYYRLLFIAAGMVALLFSLNPMRVESVAWVTARKDVLSTFWGLLALLAYVHHVWNQQQYLGMDDSARVIKRYRYLVLSIVMFSCSLLAKSIFVVLPVLLLIFDWYPANRFKKEKFAAILFEKVPFLLLSAGVIYMTLRATAGTRTTYNLMDFQTRIITIFTSFAAYLELSIIPFSINTVYYHTGKANFDIRALWAFIAIIGITAFCLIKLRKSPVLAMLWLFFLISLSPAIGVSGLHLIAPRYSYVAGCSFAFWLPLLYIKIVKQGLPAYVRRSFIAVVCIILIGFFWTTVRDIGHWQSDISVWSRVIELEPHKHGRAYYQRSLFNNLAGNYPQALQDVTEAMKIASEKQYVGIHEIYAQRALIYKNMGELTNSVADIDTAIGLSNEMYLRKYFRIRADIHNKMGEKEQAYADLKSADSFPDTKL